MTWYQKRYQTVDTKTSYRSRGGYVQKIHGSARYYGSEPAYTSISCDVVGDPVYDAAYYSQLAGYKASDRLQAKAYAKVQDKIGTPASLGVSLAEYKSTFDMITRRAITLRRAYSALRRFDLPRVAKELSLPRDVRRDAERRVSKKHLASQNWLEYWMGWAPLMADIDACVKVVTRETVQTTRFKIAAVESVTTVTGGSGPKPWPPRHSITSRKTFGYYATVRVTNPNTYLASKLGLTNPGSILWELVPFSFIAGWLVNVDQVLASYTDFVGLEVQDSGLFFLNRSSGSEVAYSWDPTGSYLRLQSCSWSGVYFERKAGAIARPPLVFAMPDRLSLTRAATSISLLTQLFIKP